MNIAKNGTAIICGEVVPGAEVEILRTLTDINRGVTVSELRTELHAKNKKHSEASLYTFLKRLLERKLVEKEVVIITVHATNYPRILWKTNQQVTMFFHENENDWW